MGALGRGGGCSCILMGALFLLRGGRSAVCDLFSCDLFLLAVRSIYYFDSSFRCNVSKHAKNEREREKGGKEMEREREKQMTCEE